VKTARAQITDAQEILTEVMRENLQAIADDFIAQIISKANNTSEGQWGDVPKSLGLRGVNEYKATLLEAMAVIAADALSRARREVPKAAKVKLAEMDVQAMLLGEFEKLPARVRKRVQEQYKLLVDSQTGDLRESIVWQFSSSHVSTDSLTTLKNDLDASVKDYMSKSVSAAAGLSASQLINETRNAFFLDDETLEQLECFQFVNEDPVVAICVSLAGQYFPKDDPELERYTPPLHWNAILEGELVDTLTGLRGIETLSAGDLVRTHKGRYRLVTEFMTRFDDKEFFEIELDNGKTLRATGEHPVLTKAGWKRVDELTFSDDVICCEDIVNES
jgi:hypothetical protein